ncbi:MAG TPA: zf-TFIIB domain-containing protein [Candidatus Binatia bacterium]|nr:zf-TFIIB domain-containing protein [Candidatus Binatia bacterium]
MDEKDYLGKILELKERAEEDRYFAERDRELIAKLKQAHEAEHEDTVRELARFRCPQCGERLLPRPYQGVNIEVCPACLGAWLSKEKLETVTLRKGRRWVRNFLAGLIQLMEHPYGEQHDVEDTAPTSPTTRGDASSTRRK